MWRFPDSCWNVAYVGKKEQWYHSCLHMKGTRCFWLSGENPLQSRTTHLFPAFHFSPSGWMQTKKKWMLWPNPPASTKFNLYVDEIVFCRRLRDKVRVIKNGNNTITIWLCLVSCLSGHLGCRGDPNSAHLGEGPTFVHPNLHLTQTIWLWTHSWYVENTYVIWM